MKTTTLKKRIGTIVYNLLTVPRTHHGEVMIRKNDLVTKHRAFKKGMPVMRKVYDMAEFEKVFVPKLKAMHQRTVLKHATKAAHRQLASDNKLGNKDN